MFELKALNLPPDIVGNIRLRWRFGTGLCSNGQNGPYGVRIDTVSITSTTRVCHRKCQVATAMLKRSRTGR